MDEKPSSCPCCGHEARITEARESEFRSGPWVIRCTACGLNIFSWVSRSEVVAMWNRRDAGAERSETR
jgi:hypothetical protein